MTQLGWEGGATLAIVVGALILFASGRLPVEVVGIAVMTVLLVTGLVPREDALSGFSNEATLTVALMLALSVGLIRTGAVDEIGRWTARLARGSEIRLIVVLIAIVLPLSALLNNTAVVAILLPAVIGVSRDSGISPSRTLMPLSFVSQLGGTLTLIGTSTNLVVAGIVLEMGLGRMRIFDITAPALFLAAAGVLYLLTVGRLLIPAREAPVDFMERYELHDYLTGLVVEHGSRLAGRSLADTQFASEYGLTVVAIEREGARVHSPSGATVLRERDLLLVEGKIADIAGIQEAEGISIAGTPPLIVEAAADPESPNLAELMVPARSNIVGRTLAELGFRTRYGVTALAVQRHGETLATRIGEIPLEPGDVLLVQGGTQAFHRLHEGRDLMLLGPVEIPPVRRAKMRLALAIMSGVVLLPALGLTTILESALLGALAMVITGCFTPREAYEEMDWSVIILLGAMIPLGLTMERTGAAHWLGELLIAVSAPLGAYGLLAAVYLTGSVLTEAVSNAAAAVILTPMAVAAATAQGLSPWPFIIAVMFAASNAFATPIGYQTNLFIYAPGGYRFSDFLRVGGPLSLILMAVATLVTPIFFPFDVP